jgi:hypothetical protein
MNKEVAGFLHEVLSDYFEICYNSLDFTDVRGRFLSWEVDRQMSLKLQKVDEIVNMMTYMYISAI